MTESKGRLGRGTFSGHSGSGTGGAPDGGGNSTCAESDPTPPFPRPVPASASCAIDSTRLHVLVLVRMLVPRVSVLVLLMGVLHSEAGVQRKVVDEQEAVGESVVSLLRLLQRQVDHVCEMASNTKLEVRSSAVEGGYGLHTGLGHKRTRKEYGCK